MTEKPNPIPSVSEWNSKTQNQQHSFKFVHSFFLCFSLFVFIRGHYTFYLTCEYDIHTTSIITSILITTVKRFPIYLHYKRIHQWQMLSVIVNECNFCADRKCRSFIVQCIILNTTLCTVYVIINGFFSVFDPLYDLYTNGI